MAVHDLLAPALLALIASVRAAARRVVVSGGPPSARRGGAKTAARANGKDEGRRAIGASAAVAPNGAQHAMDAEAVHDFRVALRRLRTTVRLARSSYGRRRLRAIGDSLRAWARATGALRDEEVLRETLGALALDPTERAELDAWIARRARQERARRSGVVRMFRDPAARRGEVGDLEAALSALEKRLSAPKRKRRNKRALARPASDLANEALARASRDVQGWSAAPVTDARAMHALRIAFKRLRYAAELFEPTIGPRAAAIAKAAAKMQKRLGELHDVDEASIRMARARGLPARAREAVLVALARERARCAARVEADLRPALDALLPACAPGGPGHAGASDPDPA